MTDDKMRHWNPLCKTDPRHTKQFQRAGGFRGTATKPIWVSMRLTEHFGPFGTGWGCEKPEFQVISAGDEMLVYCTLACWYMDGDRQAHVFGVGGDKVAVKRRDGSVVTDDEAFKKAFTDALGNAFKNVGSGADVHMGLFDDSKYVKEALEEFTAEDAEVPNASKARYIAACKQRIQSHVNGKDALGKWWKDQSQALRDYSLTQAEVDELKTMVIERGKLLDSKSDLAMAG